MTQKESVLKGLRSAQNSTWQRISSYSLALNANYAPVDSIRRVIQELRTEGHNIVSRGHTFYELVS